MSTWAERASENSSYSLTPMMTAGHLGTPPLHREAQRIVPGTVVRVGVRSATDTRANGWIPQITTITDSWSETYVGVGADKFVDVTAFETLRDLATIDDTP